MDIFSNLEYHRQMGLSLPILVQHIEAIGENLVACRDSCSDIKNHIKIPGCNLPPRCLYLETDRNPDAPGIVVVGINPGIMLAREQKFINSCFAKKQIAYSDVEKAWRKYGKCRRYYRYGEEVINKINQLSNNLWTGPILWTELIKCQNGDGVKAYHNISRSTYRNCTNKYLRNELSQVPNNFLVLGIGKYAYEALSYLCPEHPLLGIPHLTGARKSNHLKCILAALDKQSDKLTKFAIYCQSMQSGNPATAPAYWLRT